MHPMFIKDIYKKEELHIVEQDSIVLDVVKMMIEKNVHQFLVVKKNGALGGIVTLQDITAEILPDQFEDQPGMAKAMYREGFFEEMCKVVAKMKVSKIMRKKFESVTLEDNILVVLGDFLVNDLYFVPVIDSKKRPIGIVTREEIKKVLAKSLGLA